MTPEIVGLDVPKSPEIEKDTIYGIWLMITTPDKKLFVVENLKPKFASQKVPGQWNCPAETFKSPDISFEDTIQRAIPEEIGILNYDPTKIKRVGEITFTDLGIKVKAIPYYIPIKDDSSIIYEPQDSENGDHRWIDINEITPDKLLTVGQYQVPLFRSPMVENTQMLINYLNTGNTNQERTVGLTVPQELIDQLNRNPGTHQTS